MNVRSKGHKRSNFTAFRILSGSKHVSDLISKQVVSEQWTKNRMFFLVSFVFLKTKLFFIFVLCISLPFSTQINVEIIHCWEMFCSASKQNAEYFAIFDKYRLSSTQEYRSESNRKSFASHSVLSFFQQFNRGAEHKQIFRRWMKRNEWNKTKERNIAAVRLLSRLTRACTKA